MPSHQPTREARHAKNLTLAFAADHFDLSPNDLSRLEQGIKRDDALAESYRRWLNAA